MEDYDRLKATKDAYVARDREKIITEARKQLRKEWLEEEIEKLNREKKNYPLIEEPEWRSGYTEAITDQISRLEAELKALNKLT